MHSIRRRLSLQRSVYSFFYWLTGQVKKAMNPCGLLRGMRVLISSRKLRLCADFCNILRLTQRCRGNTRRPFNIMGIPFTPSKTNAPLGRSEKRDDVSMSFFSSNVDRSRGFYVRIAHASAVRVCTLSQKFLHHFDLAKPACFMQGRSSDKTVS